ncbi:ATP-binding protein [Alkalihalophilus lindianensis]|uniref:histidine kinase n=1 Tax=Alkalihalophilus lindianensis TaxID=1630542 RepID=A0ABU3XEV4_9BACI|nr:ATP-binding protein [Alkalihalophilus lindianensis]MDV2686419.1 ATP-binding protein [Alkalihalophilus lindianensis]
MKRKKTNLYTILFLFFIVITSLRIVWFQNSIFSEQPLIEDGLMDLSSFNFSNHEIYLLSGEWSYYPEVFLTPEEIEHENREKLKAPTINKKERVGSHSGTYHLKIHVPHKTTTYALKIRQIRSEFEVYSNGELIVQQGQTQTDNKQLKAMLPTIISVSPDENGMIDLLIPYKITNQSFQGGIRKPIRFGTEQAIMYDHYFTLSMQLIVALHIAFLSFYATIMFLLNPKNKMILYFSIGCIFATISIVVSDDRILANWISINYEWLVNLIYLSYTGLSIFFLLFVKELVELKRPIRIINVHLIFCAIYSLFVLLFPAASIQPWSFLLFFVLITSFVIIASLFFEVIKGGEKDSIFLLLSAISLGSSILWSTLKQNPALLPDQWATIFDPNYYPIDLIAASLLFSTYWLIHFFHTSNKNVSLVNQLQKEHVAKDQFLANTSHELRNPLHGMINIAQSIVTKEEKQLTSQSKKQLGLLITVGRRMSYLLNDLIDVTKIKQHEISLNIKTINLQPIIESVVEMQRIMTTEKPLNIELEIPKTFPLVLADPNRLNQILFNILHNAVKFTDTGGISVKVSQRNTYAIIAVKDTGIGIDKEMQSRIFLPYEQGNHSYYHESGGLGLGLSICKQLVEMHGGVLWVQSIPGKGSTFSFTLPLDNKTAAAVEAPSIVKSVITGDLPDKFINKQVNNKPKILAVDDDPVNITVLKSILSEDEYELTTVTNGQSVLSLLHKKWDLIIADVMMPHMSGYELTKRIRQHYTISELPVVLLTARNQPKDVYMGFVSGANDYVTKPVDAIELHARVQSLTNLKKSIDEQIRLEAAWLQAQIKPHFFFNTLNTILMLIETDPVRTKELLEVFCYYLQMSYSFNNLDQTVPIKDELDVVRAYVFIMNERFNNRFKVTYEVENALMETPIPPLTIQPLIENTIKHGFLNGSKEGEIIISILKEGNNVTVTVEDNGVGMKENVLNSLFNPSHKEGKGVGLININKRLNQLYGHSLNVKSEPKKGSTFSFQIPT